MTIQINRIIHDLDHDILLDCILGLSLLVISLVIVGIFYYVSNRFDLDDNDDNECCGGGCCCFRNSRRRRNGGPNEREFSSLNELLMDVNENEIGRITITVVVPNMIFTTNIPTTTTTNDNSNESIDRNGIDLENVSNDEQQQQQQTFTTTTINDNYNFTLDSLFPDILSTTSS